MKKTWIGILVVIVMSVSVMGCEQMSKSADSQMAEQTASAMKEANAQIGMPAIKNFQERKLAKMIFELRDQENLVCWAYIVNKMTGKPILLGKCIGFGLPYSVQYTSPSKLVDRYGGDVDAGQEALVVPQADPNGLFMPTSLSATWLLMINPETNKAQPVYIENEIIVSPFPLI